MGSTKLLNKKTAKNDPTKNEKDPFKTKSALKSKATSTAIGGKSRPMPPRQQPEKRTTRFILQEMRKRPYETKVFSSDLFVAGSDKTSDMDVRVADEATA